ncbi:MAG: BsuPI-related putative proteinase inhibitor [Armatimonadota bacterium]
MTTQFAVIALLLNGVQIEMPAPAVIIEGRCWAPLRPIVERLGYRILLPYDAPPYLAKDGRETEVPISRKIEGTTYVPVRWLTELGVQVAFDLAQRQVRLTAVLSKPVSGSEEDAEDKPLLARILAAPGAWGNRAVSIEGEFLGFAANPLCSATGFGPPVTRSDWVLRGPGGCIYCTRMMPFSPTESIGRRARVEGIVRLTREGWPYLECTAVDPLSGLQALACVLRTDGFFYSRGDTLTAVLTVRNDDQAPVDLTFPTGKTYDFTLTDAAGTEVWRWSADKAFTQALVKRTLKPAESYNVDLKVDLGEIAGLEEGRYHLGAELPGITKAYPVLIQVKDN